MGFNIQLIGKNSFPALSEKKGLRYFTFIVMYLAQGIPEGMTLFGIPAWMAMNGKSATEIGGYVALVMIPFSFKVLAAPFMEKFTYLPMGRRRPWLLVGQFGLALSFLALSMVPDPLNNLGLLTTAVLSLTIFIVFQDIATDSLAIDIVPLNEQAKANGFMWGAKIIGTSGSLALGTWLLNHYGFAVAIRMLSVLIFMIMLVPLVLRERPGEKLLPWTTGSTSPESKLLTVDSWSKLFISLKKVLFLPNGLVLALSLFIVLTAFSFIRTLLPVFTIQELGWTNESYSQIYASSNLVCGIIGMVIGGVLLDRFGIIRILQIYLSFAALLTAVTAFSKIIWYNIYFFSIYISLFNLLFVLVTIGTFAIAMRCCWKRISALQFTFYMGLYNLGLTAGAAMIGPLRNYFSWEYTILTFSILALVAMFLLRFMKIDNHLKHVDELEKGYLEGR